MSKNIEWGLIHGDGEIVATCDYCDKDETAQEFSDGWYDFKEAQENLKAEGWCSMKIGGEWYDFCCTECKQKFLDERVKNT